jgi:hypothetical protein
MGFPLINTSAPEGLLLIRIKPEDCENNGFADQRNNITEKSIIEKKIFIFIFLNNLKMFITNSN